MPGNIYRNLHQRNSDFFGLPYLSTDPLPDFSHFSPATAVSATAPQGPCVVPGLSEPSTPWPPKWPDAGDADPVDSVAGVKVQYAFIIHIHILIYVNIYI